MSGPTVPRVPPGFLPAAAAVIPAVRRIQVYAEADAYAASRVGEAETPPGSNRSPFIDGLAREFGSPLGSFWCALFAGHVRRKYGLWVPTCDVGSCDEWVYQAMRAGRWSTTPTPLAVVIYRGSGVFPSGRYAGQADAHHAGLVTLDSPRDAYEGNTANAAGFNRNGGEVARKRIHQAGVYGYVAA